MTHSQFGQDDEIVKFFNEKTDGYFLDIGAHNDGQDTILLEEMGWSGICVEPLDVQYANLLKIRKCVCKNICVGDRNGEVDFLHNEGYTSALSGVLEYYCNEHKHRIESEKRMKGGQSFVVKKNMKTLTTLLDEENSPTHIELLKIDAEGGEFAILSGVDFSKYTFDLITLEANYSEEINRCAKLLWDNGYAPFQTVGMDAFFKRRDDESG